MKGLKVLESTGLIKVYETDKGEQVVDARELHEGLGSKQDFSDWVKKRIDECDGIENKDFTIILGKSTGGRPSKEYILKLEISKEMAMLERNEEGKKYRRYFIEVEKKYKQLQAPKSVEDLIIMQAESVKQLRSEVATTNEKVDKLNVKVDNKIIIDHRQSGKIKEAIAVRVRELLGEGEEYKKFSKRYFSALYRDIYKRMGVASYMDIKTKDFEQVLEYIKHWVAPVNIMCA